jgi:hypothetical protein
MVSISTDCESHCNHTSMFETGWELGDVLCGSLYTSMDISTSYNWRSPPSLNKRCYSTQTRSKEVAMFA